MDGCRTLVEEVDYRVLVAVVVELGVQRRMLAVEEAGNCKMLVSAVVVRRMLAEVGCRMLVAVVLAGPGRKMLVVVAVLRRLVDELAVASHMIAELVHRRVAIG